MRRIIGALLVTAFGVAFVALGLWLRATMQPYDDGVVTEATVVDLEAHTDEDGTTYAAVFEFTTAAGETVRVEDGFSSSNPPRIGSTIEVSYRPADPAGARNLDNPAWFAWIFVGIGAIAVLVGLAIALPLLLAAGIIVVELFRRDDEPDVFGSLDPATGRVGGDVSSRPSMAPPEYPMRQSSTDDDRR